EVEVEKLHLPTITALQVNAARLPHALRGFIEWLRPEYHALGPELQRAREQIRRDMQSRRLHLRQPEAIANLYVGVDLFLRYAEERGGLPRAETDETRARVLDVLQELARRQAEQLGNIGTAER